ncbi:tannase and feruloyl esterase [Aspergillus piperis CBS 112811]|uniref:Carboxylic ester hydrolase n=1 Tax=Aspergillus piperis CBS 112811 TaxID=1448313 RepID=A0A8G1VQX0_9EURO|nr:tannase and feruloyl esterase [Aspergillus piperis CBS 112811]RAH62494.1 tannase and feruloyl esterase [Aspergillus piperis CBS 112811]
MGRCCYRSHCYSFSQQQTNHMFPPVVEKTMGYYSPPCELEQGMYEIIDACDALDGRTDGVVSRTDPCKLNFNLSSSIGIPYFCNAASAITGYEPAQNGTITAEGVAAVEDILKGLHDPNGLGAYLSFQYGTSLDDATTIYDETTNSWTASTSETSNLEWSNFTYDTLREYIYTGWQMYEETLQTTWPDLTATLDAGVKIIHHHGESDSSIPPALSVHYHESVRSILYPDLSFNESTARLNAWYKLFLVPGGAHCAANPYQGGPWPQTTLGSLIEWVEQGVVPERLNATYTSGSDAGSEAQLCAWPSRPLWSGKATKFDCVYDQASIDTWHYRFDSYKEPLY